MKIEQRADGVHICGYVNATGKPSRPIVTPHGKVIEIIEERAFKNTLESGRNVTLTVDHEQRAYASTNDGSLKLKEDNIGLYADGLISDSAVIDMAKKGKIKGWSFGMQNVADTLEQRADDIPIRRIKSLDLDHITLVVNKNPCYAATSVEVRAEGDAIMETRGLEDATHISIPKPDYTGYEERIEALRK